MKDIDLVFHEAFDESGIELEARLGKCPSTERLTSLSAALANVAATMEGEDTIDRRLATALFGLSFHFEASMAAIRDVRDVADDVDAAILELFDVIEQFFDV